MARGEISPDQIAGIAVTYAASSPLGGTSVQTGSYSASASDSGRLLAFNSSGGATYSLPSTALGTQWTVTLVNLGSGTLTVPVPTTGLLNNSASTPITLGTGQATTIFSDGAGNYFYTESSTSSPVSATHSEILTDAAGNIVTINGDTIYVSGIPG